MTLLIPESNGDSIPAKNLPALISCKNEEDVTSCESVNSWPETLNNSAHHSDSTRCDLSGPAASSSTPPQHSSITTITSNDSSNSAFVVNETPHDGLVVVSSPSLTPQHHSSVTTITSEDISSVFSDANEAVPQQHSSITTINSSSSSVMNEVRADGLVIVTSPTPQHSSITTISSSASSVMNQVFVDGECHLEVVVDEPGDSKQHHFTSTPLQFEGEAARETQPSPPSTEGTNSPGPVTTVQATNMTLAAACSATHPLTPHDLTPATEGKVRCETLSWCCKSGKVGPLLPTKHLLHFLGDFDMIIFEYSIVL